MVTGSSTSAASVLCIVRSNSFSGSPQRQISSDAAHERPPEGGSDGQHQPCRMRVSKSKSLSRNQLFPRRRERRRNEFTKIISTRSHSTQVTLEGERKEIVDDLDHA